MAPACFASAGGAAGAAEAVSAQNQPIMDLLVYVILKELTSLDEVCVAKVIWDDSRQAQMLVLIELQR